jgi:hypothetical protein
VVRRAVPAPPSAPKQRARGARGSPRARAPRPPKGSRRAGRVCRLWALLLVRAQQRGGRKGAQQGGKGRSRGPPRRTTRSHPAAALLLLICTPQPAAAVSGLAERGGPLTRCCRPSRLAPSPRMPPCPHARARRGILYGPATGLALAELIADGTARAVDIAPFDPARRGRAHEFGAV